MVDTDDQQQQLNIIVVDDNHVKKQLIVYGDEEEDENENEVVYGGDLIVEEFEEKNGDEYYKVDPLVVLRNAGLLNQPIKLPDSINDSNVANSRAATTKEKNEKEFINHPHLPLLTSRSSTNQTNSNSNFNSNDNNNQQLLRYYKKSITSLSSFNEESFSFNKDSIDKENLRSDSKFLMFKDNNRVNLFDIAYKTTTMSTAASTPTTTPIRMVRNDENLGKNGAAMTKIDCDLMIRNLANFKKKKLSATENGKEINSKINKNSIENNNEQTMKSLASKIAKKSKLKQFSSQSLNDLSRFETINAAADFGPSDCSKSITFGEESFLKNKKTNFSSGKVSVVSIFNLERENTNFSIKLSYDHPFDSSNSNRFDGGCGMITPHAYTDMEETSMMMVEPNLRLAELNAQLNRELTIVDVESGELQDSTKRFHNRNFLVTDSFMIMNRRNVGDNCTIEDENDLDHIQRVRSEQVTPDLYDLPEPRRVEHVYTELNPKNIVNAKLKKAKKFIRLLTRNAATDSNSIASSSLSSSRPSNKLLLPSSRNNQNQNQKRKKANTIKNHLHQRYHHQVASKITTSSVVDKDKSLSLRTEKQLEHDATTINRINRQSSIRLRTQMELTKPRLTRKTFQFENAGSNETRKSSRSQDTKITRRSNETNDETGTSSLIVNNHRGETNNSDYLNFRDEYLRRIESILITFKEREIATSLNFKDVVAADDSRQKRKASFLVGNHKAAAAAESMTIVRSLRKPSALKEFKYCVLSDLKIGEGEFGETFQGYRYDLGTPIRIAAKRLKTIRESNKDDQNSINFLNEITVLSQLDKHDHVIEYLGIHRFESTLYIIFEYAEKGNLKHLLDLCRKNMKQQRELYLCNLFKMKMAYEIASGMEYVSSLDIVHKDLAARNILLDKNFGCKVADFGCCQNDFLKKRPIRWMAPESLGKLLFTTSSDIWSYGVLLWEIYTYGMTPYPGMTDDEVINRINQWYRLYKPHDCPKEVYSIMISCWKEFHKARPRFSSIKHKLRDIYRPMHDSCHLLSTTINSNCINNKHNHNNNENFILKSNNTNTISSSNIFADML